MPSTLQWVTCCPDCEYDLRGLSSAACPECGLDIAGILASGAGRLPWERRATLGWLRGYLATVLLAIYRPRRFARAALFTGGYGAARGFQLITCVIGLVALALGVWRVLAESADARAVPQQVEPWLLAVAAASVFLFLVLATGVPSYFFHPAALPVRRQNRAIALSYYAVAPLALSPLVAIVSIILIAAGRAFPRIELGASLAASVLPLAVPFVMWTSVLRIARTVRLPPARVVWAAALIPPLWVALFFLIVVGVPAGCLFIAIVVRSFA